MTLTDAIELIHNKLAEQNSYRKTSDELWGSIYINNNEVKRFVYNTETKQLDNGIELNRFSHCIRIKNNACSIVERTKLNTFENVVFVGSLIQCQALS